jgi:hypothetical protein
VDDPEFVPRQEEESFFYFLQNIHNISGTSYPCIYAMDTGVLSRGKADSLTRTAEVKNE